MKFIHCFTEELKNKLLQSGFKLLGESNGLFIFENNSSIKMNFSQNDTSQFVFSNKMFV